MGGRARERYCEEGGGGFPELFVFCSAAHGQFVEQWGRGQRKMVRCTSLFTSGDSTVKTQPLSPRRQICLALSLVSLCLGAFLSSLTRSIWEQEGWISPKPPPPHPPSYVTGFHLDGGWGDERAFGRRSDVGNKSIARQGGGEFHHMCRRRDCGMCRTGIRGKMRIWRAAPLQGAQLSSIVLEI